MNRRGFTTIEMIATVIILGAVAVFGTRLMSTSMRSIYDAVAARESIGRYEAAMTALRADVLQSTQLSSPAADQLLIDGHIAWNANSAGLDRTDGEHEQQWNGVRFKFQTTTTGIEVVPAGSEPGQFIMLVSIPRWIEQSRQPVPR